MASLPPSPPLPEAFLTTPLAHRGYHDKAVNRSENSRAAIRAAIDAGYGIEIDLQLSADDQVMVFHDYHLDRLTAEDGAIRQRHAHELKDIPLLCGTETIPPISDALEIVAGRVPLLIEIKDQDGTMGPDVGPLEIGLADALSGYSGPVAVMGFNPHAVRAFGEAAPNIPRGLTTGRFLPENWPTLPEAVRARLRGIPDFDTLGAAFISHAADGLAMAPVRRLRARGVPILCWTIRSPEEEAAARMIADNVTFEGYAAAFPLA